MDPDTTTLGIELLHWISQYGYAALLPLFVIEGPVVGIVSGILVSVGTLKLLPVFLLYVAGTLISDTILYYFARDGDQYLEKIPLGAWAIDRVHTVLDSTSDAWKQKFKDNYFTVMVVAKLAPVNLVSEFVALTAGAMKIPARTFYAPVLVAQPIWSASIIAVGYYFGDVIKDPQKIFTEASLVFVVLVCLFILYRRYMYQYMQHGILGKIFSVGKGEE